MAFDFKKRIQGILYARCKKGRPRKVENRHQASDKKGINNSDFTG